MESATARRSGGGLFEGLYRVIMRRNSVYVTFVIAGAFLGERAVDYGVHRLWEYNNVGVCHLFNVCPLYFFFGALHALTDSMYMSL
ncbi:PREDICTED: cytochrome b-c1 complex subunit 9-like isoform 1 [Fragaria vesca subsp. vesca]